MIEVNIRSENPSFNKLSEELASAFIENKLAIFSGAGVSIPSGLPGSPKLIRGILNSMIASLEALSLGSTDERKSIGDAFPNPRLE